MIVSVAEYDPDDPGRSLEFRDVTAIPAQVTVPPDRYEDPAYLEALDREDPAAANEVRDAAAGAVRRDSVDVSLELPRAAVVRVSIADNDDALAADDVAYVVVPPPSRCRRCW